MKARNIIPVFLLLLTAALNAQEKFEYLSPRPDAKMVSRQTGIIIRKGDIIDPSSLIVPGIIEAEGEKSGIHRGRTELSGDGKTILFFPNEPFAADEKVTVKVNKGIRNSHGAGIGTSEFSFTTSKLKQKIVLPESTRTAIMGETPAMNKAAADSLPSDFPKITINSVDNPAPGYIFLTVSREAPGIGFYNMILDNTGAPVRYIKEEHYSYDFKVQKNNLLSYADISESHWYVGGGESTHKVLDENLTVIDSFRMGNGYVADSHDFQMLPNGHVLMFGYDLQPVDMSKVVEGGNPGALVAGSIIQEVDEKKNVVFEWRSWDYIPITDSYRDLTIAALDYIHVNAIEPDYDGNILISCRETSDIIKINRTTGEIMWRMGGKKNQFTFLNENEANAPQYFSLQHSVRRLDNGNIILFDNGNYHSPSYSRAVEYKVDEINKTATLVWDYRHTPDIFVSSRGSVQRLPNGNTLIGWGIYSETKGTAVTEVTPDKKVVFELSLPKGISSYRAYRFPFGTYSPAASVRMFDLLPLNLYSFNNKQDSTNIKVKFTKLNIGYNSMQVTRHKTSPVNSSFNGEVPVTCPVRAVIQAEGIDDFKADIRFSLKTYIPNIPDPQNVIVYYRKNESQGTFEALPTSYDDVNKEIIASTSSFGEFIFCRPYPSQTPGLPLLVSPADKDSVNEKETVEIRWTPRGYTTSYYLQISNDSSFSSLLVDKPSLTSSVYTLKDLKSSSKYYWRVKSACSFGESGFSAAGMFHTIAPFIKVTYPNGGEVLKPGNDYFIRWQDNIGEAVKISLLKNGSLFRVLTDSVISIGSYKFSIPSDFPSDSSFTIRIFSLKDTLLADQSDRRFSVNSNVSAVEDGLTPEEYQLKQNYPNPFNASTMIQYTLPAESRVEVKIFNSLGQQAASLADGIQHKGVYRINWNASNMASGIYLLSIKAFSIGGKEQLNQTRKMVLMK